MKRALLRQSVKYLVGYKSMRLVCRFDDNPALRYYTPRPATASPVPNGVEGTWAEWAVCRLGRSQAGQRQGKTSKELAVVRRCFGLTLGFVLVR